jgi:hypothetical protein
MNNVCPTCGTAYSVTRNDMGRRIACKKCRTPLMVTEKGLQIDDPDLGDGDSTMGLPSKAIEGDKSIPRIPIASPRLPFSTYLFAGGTCLVIVFLFLPLIDQAKVASRNAAIEEGELTLSEDLEREKDPVLKKRFEDDWAKEKKRLERKVRYAKLNVDSGVLFNRYGMMIGFLLLAFGSIGYLSPNQSSIRRIVGAIVLVAMLILIFIVFVIAGGVASAFR